MICEMTLYQKFYLACKLGNADRAMAYFYRLFRDMEGFEDYDTY